MGALIEMHQGHQGIPRRARDQGCRFRPGARRDPRAGRRERRRQIDADQDHRRRHRADLGRNAVRRSRSRCSVRPRKRSRTASSWCFRRTASCPSMSVAQNVFLGDEKFFNRIARPLHRRAAVHGVAQFQRRSMGHRRDARRREEADGGNRARRAPERARHHFRRTDGLADARGEAPFLRADAAPQGARRVDHLHLATRSRKRSTVSDRITILRDGEVVDDRRHLGRSIATRSFARWSGAACPTNSTSRHGRTARQPGRKVLSVQNLSMGIVVRNNSFTIYAGQITGIFGLIGSGRTETAKIVAGVLKRTLLLRRRDPAERQAGALSRPAPGREGRHRLCH